MIVLGRLLNPYFYARLGNVGVRVSVSEARRILGDRFKAVFPILLDMVGERCFGGVPVERIEKGGFVHVFSRDAGAMLYGFVCREAEELEREFRRRFSGVSGGIVCFFRSRGSLRGFRILEYALAGDAPAVEGWYGLLGRFCRWFTVEYGFYAGILGARGLGVVCSGLVSPPEEVEGVVGSFRVSFRLSESRHLDFSVFRDRWFASRFLMFLARSKLTGFIRVSGGEVYRRDNIAPPGLGIRVLPGFRFSIPVFRDGFAGLVVEPCRLVLSDGSLRNFLSGRDVDSALGLRVRSSRGFRGVVVGVSRYRAGEHVDRLGGRYVDLPGCEGADPEEQLFMVETPRGLVLEAGSLLTVSFSPRDLKRFGFYRRVYRLLQLSAGRVLEESRSFAKMISPLEAAGLTVRFSSEPAEVEVL